MKFSDKLVKKVIIVDINAVILDVLERPLVHFGRKVAVLMPDFQVKAIDFGTFPNALLSLSPTPWRHTWVNQNRLWYHFDKLSKEYSVVDESSLPVYRKGGLFYPGTWLIEERDDGIVIGANALGGEHPQLGVTSRSGFHLYYHRGQRVELLNQDAIPYLIWSVWREGTSLILAGMTYRSSDAEADDSDEEVSLGRPALIRCSLDGDRWEEISLAGSAHADAEIIHRYLDGVGQAGKLQFEAWVGNEHATGHGRILIAALAKKSTTLLDNLASISVMPLVSDYDALAFVSCERSEVVLAEMSGRLVSILFTQGRTLFVICRRIEDDGQIVGGLHIIDPQSHGLKFLEMRIDGIDPRTTFYSLTVAFFGEAGYFGVLVCEKAPDHVFIHSDDALDWRVVGTSGTVECRQADEFYDR
ncbi:hypothetical protein [Cupriavidus sp. SW-Y-13]|uniref:hypothetical protein n=1 Tax=Cupriavidus sp. SW-Y-13 TaxID=2653854 RepID=UPI0013652FF4|nr:hypothetical protein [Cupriavidus sp. SW-Y-13]MWL90504.1 hypothetical protein [Cupriavidus sp. SW-Y-13]